MNKDFAHAFAKKPMSAFQIQAIFICLVINMLDGFDVLVMAFTASSVASEWNLESSELGVLLSAGLIGMAMGSIFLSPLADKWGRRPLILLCLAIISIGMLCSAISRNEIELAALRLATGVGIGGMLASLTVIVSEYTSTKYRNFTVSFLQCGYPIGAVIGGMIAAYLIKAHGWRAVFLFGGVSSLAMIPLVYWRLPESVDFILTTRPPNALVKVNQLLKRMDNEALTSLPDNNIQPSRSKAKISRLFSNNLIKATMLAWAAYFLVMFSFYFVLSWTPKLLVSNGLSAQGGISAGVLINLGGIIGGLMLGYLSARTDLKKMLTIYMGLTAALMITFGYISNTLMVSVGLGVLIGFCLFGSMIGLYAFVPSIYPTEVRATGMGWAIGIGRVGAILSPLLAGALIDGGWGMSSLYTLFALPLIFSAILFTQAKRVT